MIYKKPFFCRLLPMLLCVVLAATGVSPAIAKSDKLTIITLGSGQITPKTSAGIAKQIAIKDGQQQAVAAALEEMMPLEVLTDNFEEISAIAFGHAQKFISNYEVLAVSEEQDLCRVLVRVAVSIRSLEKAVKAGGILLDRDNPPVVLSLIRETSKNKPLVASTAIVTKSLSRSLSTKGITTITHDQWSSGNALFADATSNNEGDISDTRAIHLAREYNADFVIIGRAEVSSPLQDMLPAGSKQVDAPLVLALNGRLLNVKTGTTLAKVTEDGGVPAQTDYARADINTLFESAGQALARKFAPPIVMTWENRTDASQTIIITVQGSSHISKLEAFRKSLQDIHKVRSARISEMSIQQAVITVNFSGSADRLAAAISSYSPKLFKAKVVNVSKNNIRLTLGS